MFEEFAFEEEVCPIGDAQCFLHIVIGDENADIFLFEFGHDLLNVFHGDGVNACEGFIEEDEFGVGCQGAGDFGSSTFST